MLEFPGNVFGLALNLERDSVGAVVLGDYEHLSEGDWVRCTGRVLEVPSVEALLGRVVDSLGAPIDGKGPIGASHDFPASRRSRPASSPASRWTSRCRPGIKAIDAMVPDRSRPARADHRRPPDRQDRGGDRRHHQSEGHRR